MPTFAAPLRAEEPSLGIQVANGLFTVDFPTSGAILVGSDAASAHQNCTGTLIGCQTILTAAHCVCLDEMGNPIDGVHCPPSGSQGLPPERIFVLLQHAGLFGVSGVEVHPDFVPFVFHGDVALLRLSAPVEGIVPTPFNEAGTPLPGVSGRIVGFGETVDAETTCTRKPGPSASETSSPPPARRTRRTTSARNSPIPSVLRARSRTGAGATPEGRSSSTSVRGTSSPASSNPAPATTAACGPRRSRARTSSSTGSGFESEAATT
jgi:hypothetical protein